MKFETFSDGIVIQGDCLDPKILSLVLKTTGGGVPLIMADPPYGNIVKEKWDKSNDVSAFIDWMIDWTNAYTRLLIPNGAFYVWGGIGRPKFRPFFEYINEVEHEDLLTLSNLITWSKKRGYGVQHNYLFTREELAYFIKGNDPKKPHIFNVPYLSEKRGYAGFNKKYPAKSEYKRRTNVWTDITEIMQGKIHPTQKASRVIQIPIEVHTNQGDWVIDPFAGSGETAQACRKLGRKFVVIDKNPVYYNLIIGELCKTEHPEQLQLALSSSE